MSISIEFGEQRLHAVPAVHFRVAFAEEVHRLCSRHTTRPAAIAVELGCETAAAVAAWLHDLGVRPGVRVRLPCMLAAARRQPLIELPAPRLGATLGMTYLSPTDSIIEAIRCALELGVPLYGVDIEGSPQGNRRETLIEDPSRAARQVARYVSRNALYAEGQRDEEIDSPRELTMAAALKTLLARHKKVLFTGGLAHWPRLEKLLVDPSVGPAPVSAVGNETPVGFDRVIVHPLLAIYHMDVFPAFAESYERQRQNVDQFDAGTTWDTVDPVKNFAQLLNTTYTEHFTQAGGDHQLDRRIEDLEARSDFEQLATNLCLLEQTQVPTLFTALIAAQGVMSSLFCERLAEILMKFPWALPDDFPKLMVIAPAPAETGDYIRGELLQPDGNGYYNRRGESLYVRANPGDQALRVEVKVPWKWADEPQPPRGPSSRLSSNQPLTWPPTVYLLGAMSFHAMQVAVRATEDTRVELFEGSIGDGLDIKATLRAQARGDDRFFVRQVHRARTPRSDSGGEWDPIVWLLRPGSVMGEWETMGYEHETLVANAHDQKRLRRVAEERGSTMIEAIGYGRRYYPGEIPEELGAPLGVRRSKSISWCFSYHGILLYVPPFFDAAQEAAWAERVQYERAPFYSSAIFDSRSGAMPESLRRVFRERHSMDLDGRDWPVCLVRMAVPYAREAVTVVAPDRFSLSAVVFDEARRRAVKLRVVPHSYFPRDILRKLGLLYWVPPASASGRLEFDPSFNHVFGESPNAYRQLIPRRWLQYARGNP